jgi:hypothetical protein
MHVSILLTVVAVAHAFNFGGFTLPSIPVLPTIPADIASLIPENIPSYAFNRTSEFPAYPSLPAFPSIDLESYRSVLPDYKSLLPTPILDPNEILKSLDISPLPTARVPSIPTLDDFGLRDNDLLDFWRTNRTLKVPESEQELRDFVGNRTKFDFDRADALVDRLSDEVGTDIRPSIRMIAGLVLNNQSFDQVYRRSTSEFTVYTQRLRDDARNLFNFTNTQVSVPLIDLANRTLSVIRYVQNPYAALSGQRLNSSVISIMVADLVGNETQIRDLPELLNFTLPVDGTAGTCVYWNEPMTTWATDGCQLLGVLDGVATCGCNHLTDFAFIAAIPSPSATYLSIPSPSATYLSIPSPSATYLRMGSVFNLPISTQTPTPLVIGLASAGAVLVIIGLAAIYFNCRTKPPKSIRSAPPRWSYPATVVVGR